MSYLIGFGRSGIKISGTGNYYANNRSHGGGPNYDVASGNTSGGGNVEF